LSHNDDGGQNLRTALAAEGTLTPNLIAGRATFVLPFTLVIFSRGRIETKGFFVMRFTGSGDPSVDFFGGKPGNAKQGLHNEENCQQNQQAMLSIIEILEFHRQQKLRMALA